MNRIQDVYFSFARYAFLTALLFSINNQVLAQQKTDSVSEKILSEIVIRAFEQNKKLRDVPAAINYVGKEALERYGAISVLQAVNSTPGVRMEERSPGSFRFNIRGSSLRSPFGVRNVKVYFNEIPITDPGGNTYLNQLGFYNVSSIEIIKGPGSSLYGAGTGGVLLIESLNGREAPGLSGEYHRGSYGYNNFYGAATMGNSKWVSQVGFQYQKSNGFRDHSRMERKVQSWTGLFHINDKRILKTTFLFGDLFYETPGALTLTEYKMNPRSARPPTGQFPGAITSKASIHQTSFIVGSSFWQQLTSHLQSTSMLYGMFTELRNPTIRNYGKNSEPHFGARSTFKWNQQWKSTFLQLTAGGEWQKGLASISIHKNSAGKPDSLQSSDQINNQQSFVFFQASLDVHSWMFTAGGSLHSLRIKFQRFTPATLGLQSRNFSHEFSPRFSVMKKFKSFNVYTSVSRGFSPPTTAELLPTGGTINTDLNEEKGTNWDLGFKGGFQRFSFDVTVFQFSLHQTIVQRRDAGGGDFFVNAGKTSQHGIETYMSYPLLRSVPAIQSCMLWISHTWHDFHYTSFKQLNNDYSGKQLPGVSSHTVAAGIDIEIKGLMANVNGYYGGPVPLNDANLVFASSYYLLGCKFGFQKKINENWNFKLMAGADNLFNQRYSLGNDINGFGGRYFNAAAGRNFFVTFFVGRTPKKTS